MNSIFILVAVLKGLFGSFENRIQRAGVRRQGKLMLLLTPYSLLNIIC